MIWRNTRDSVLGVFSLALFLALVSWCGYSVARDVRNWWVHRNEPVYAVSRMYDPVYRGQPASRISYMICNSPARCEPSGRPSWQYFMLVKEYELKEVGLDPAHEIPYKE